MLLWFADFGNALVRGMGMEKNKSLKGQIIFIISALMTFVSVVIILLSYKAFYEAHIDFYHDKALGIVKMLANEIDGDKISEYIQTGEKDEYYDQVLKHLNNVKENTTDVSYLYVFVPYNDHFVYVMDAYTSHDDMDNISGLGDVYNYGNTEYKYLVPDIKSKSASTKIVHGENVGFGDYIAVWAPVFNSEGEVAAMIEADYRLQELQKNVFVFLVKLIFFMLMAEIVMAIIMIEVMNLKVVNPILLLTNYVKSYKSGELEPMEISFNENNEIKWLADSFSEMNEKIKSYVSHIEQVTAEKERIGAELNIATQIQADMLPCIFPPFPGRTEIDIFASMNPAKEVGGDFYDFFLVDDNHLALVIADVSGKGVPAALFMVIAKTLIKNQLLLGTPPNVTLERVNNQLCENNEAGMFVTVWLGIYDISTGVLTASNAGHEYPAIKHKDGTFELYKDKHGIVIAAMEDMSYSQYDIQLQEGDVLFVFTDGVAEASDIDEKLFGTDRMLDALNKHSNKELEGLLDGVKTEIDEFVGEAPQFDDITMLAIRINEIK